MAWSAKISYAPYQKLLYVHFVLNIQKVFEYNKEGERTCSLDYYLLLYTQHTSVSFEMNKYFLGIVREFCIYVYL